MNAHSPTPTPAGPALPRERAHQHFPRGALAGAAAFLIAVVVYVGLYRQTEPVPRDLSSAHLVVPLLFEDRADGAVVVRRPETGEVLQVFDPGTNGFVRGAMRGLARDRKRREIGPDVPFTLVLWPNGQLSLEDTATHASIDLSAFGPSNVEPFKSILRPPGDAS